MTFQYHISLWLSKPLDLSVSYLSDAIKANWSFQYHLFLWLSLPLDLSVSNLSHLIVTISHLTMANSATWPFSMMFPNGYLSHLTFQYGYFSMATSAIWPFSVIFSYGYLSQLTFQYVISLWLSKPSDLSVSHFPMAISATYLSISYFIK